MDRLPLEICDMILEYVHPLETEARCEAHPTVNSMPLDTRRKSNCEPLLRNPKVECLTPDVAVYKELRQVFPSYYSRLLFHTVLLYPHKHSLERLVEIAQSCFAKCVRRVVISLPFFSPLLMARLMAKADPIAKIKLADYWCSFPRDLQHLLRQFDNLKTIVILPSWDRRLQWMQRQRYRDTATEHLLTFSWFGCIDHHFQCQRVAEINEVANLQSILGTLNNLRDQIQQLHVFNLGSVWLNLLSQPYEATGALEVVTPINPETLVSMDLVGRHAAELAVYSCALSDLIWFTRVFENLVHLCLEGVGARDSNEVTLFAASLNRQLYPGLRKITVKSSNLPPRDYLSLFQAIKDHEGLRDVSIEQVHIHCWDSTVGKDFTFRTDAMPENDMQQKLREYFNGTLQIEECWIGMFTGSGCSHC